MRLSATALVCLFLGACNCADPAIRPDAGAPIVESDATVADARTLEDARAPLDAARAPDDLGPPRVRDAYVPREPPPDPPEGACEGTASVRRVDDAVDRPGARGGLRSARWGDGLLVEWNGGGDGLTRNYVGRVAEPIAGLFEPLRSSLGARHGAWLPTAAGGIRFVQPGLYAELGSEGFGTELPLPAPPPGFEEPSPYVACVGAEAVAVYGRRDGESVVSVLEWIDGAPRWSAPVDVPPDAREMSCFATGDARSVVWTTATGVVVARQWDARGEAVPELAVWEIDGEPEYVQVAAVERRDESDSRLVVAVSADPPETEIAFHLGRWTLGAIETVGSTRVALAGGASAGVYGAALLGGRVVIVYSGMLLSTITVDPETGVFGPPAIVAGHSCDSWGNGVLLPSGLYVALSCSVAGTWLLRVCGDST